MPLDVETKLIDLTIDGKTISVPKGTTVYTAAKQLGIEIPIFCYQDRMPPFGACRMCLVQVEKMAKLQTSCTLEATQGMVVNTQSTMALEGRKGIIEFLLINHPLDCPICDRGGECPLQENAMQCGPGESRFFEDKRRFKKPLPLGPVLTLDRERCIICARCTRFGDVIAGDHALEFYDRGYKTEVGTPDGGPAESKFIGNTIMICPVGALTSQVYRFRARPWDNFPTETTCTLCPVGCSMILDSRDGEIMRTRSRENHEVNDIWLCDKGWFGYEFSANPERLQKPLIRRQGKLEEASWDEALDLAATKIRAALPSKKIAAFGGNPLTVEENFLFQKLMREVAGINHVDHRIGTPIFDPDEEEAAPGMEISIGDSEKLSFAVLLGLDLTEEFPVIWLRLRQAINRGAKVIYMGHYALEIAPHLTKTIVHAPGTELEMLHKLIPEIEALTGPEKNGALFIGRQYLSTHNRKAILIELEKLRQAHHNLSLNIMEGSGNSFGARYAGMHPNLGPRGARLSSSGLNALQVLQNASESNWKVLYVAGTNPAAKFPSPLWNKARSNLEFLIVQDLFLTETAQQADIVLPTLSYVEKGGTFINIEGRIQTVLPGKEIPENLYSDGAIFTMLAQKLGKSIQSSDFKLPISGERLPQPTSRERNLNAESPGNKILNSGTSVQDEKLAATFAPVLFDHGTRMKHNTRLVQLAKEPRIRLNPNEAEKRGFRDNDTVSITHQKNTIMGKIQVDKSVAAGTVVLPLGFESLPVHELGENLLNGLLIEVKKYG